MGHPILPKCREVVYSTVSTIPAISRRIVNFRLADVACKKGRNLKVGRLSDTYFSQTSSNVPSRSVLARYKTDFFRQCHDSGAI